MTVEEAIQAAEAGDIDAMMKLGAYYMSGEVKGEGARDIGADWYAKAARAGNVAAVVPLCAYKTIRVILDREIYGADDERVLAEWKEIFEWRRYGLKLLQSKAMGWETVNADKYIEDLDYERYNLALSYLLAHDMENAFANVKGFEDIKSQILLAAIVADNYDNVSEAWEIFNLMKIIEGNLEYANAEKERYEEYVYAVVAKRLSAFYRILSGDNNHALHVLQFVRAFLKEENSIELINQEIAHFRKRLFGGYNYIED